LVASANWVLGELAPCLPEERLFSFLCHLFYFFLSQGRSAYHLTLAISHLLLPVLFLYTWATELLIFNEKHHHTSLPEFQSCFQEMSADVYSSLLKALAMPDKEDTSCYPVRVSAAGAIATLLEVCLWMNSFGFCNGSRYNLQCHSGFSPGFYSCSFQNDYAPPEWLPLLEVVIGRISNRDEESSILCQLLSSIVEAGDENVAFHIPYIVSSLVGAISKLIPANPEPWSQVCVDILG